jgi:hypothetical protein
VALLQVNNYAVLNFSIMSCSGKVVTNNSLKHGSDYVDFAYRVYLFGFYDSQNKKY